MGTDKQIKKAQMNKQSANPG